MNARYTVWLSAAPVKVRKKALHDQIKPYQNVAEKSCSDPMSPVSPRINPADATESQLIRWQVSVCAGMLSCFMGSQMEEYQSCDNTEFTMHPMGPMMHSRGEINMTNKDYNVILYLINSNLLWIVDR